MPCGKVYEQLNSCAFLSKRARKSVRSHRMQAFNWNEKPECIALYTLAPSGPNWENTTTSAVILGAISRGIRTQMPKEVYFCSHCTTAFCLLRGHPSNQWRAYRYATIKLKALSEYLHGCSSNGLDLHAHLTHTHLWRIHIINAPNANRMHAVMEGAKNKAKYKM